MTARRRLARLVTGAALAGGALGACVKEEAPRPPMNPDPAANTYSPTLGVVLTAFNKTQGGVYFLDLTPGTGTVAIPGRKVTVHYTGWLPDGTKFDSSVDKGTPFTFTLGAGEVIRGWDDGVTGMKVGGRRKLVIPASLGYGAEGSPPDIPPNAVLVFEVSLLTVQ